jgi:hypothetical protein
MVLALFGVSARACLLVRLLGCGLPRRHPAGEVAASVTKEDAYVDCSTRCSWVCSSSVCCSPVSSCVARCLNLAAVGASGPAKGRETSEDGRFKIQDSRL